jgi:hypothetical protein
VLDDGLPRIWPDGVQEACRQLSQGDVLELHPFFYLADTRRPVWLLSRALAEEQDKVHEERGIVVADLSPDSGLAPAYVILTSQTCDIGEEGELWEFPCVQVAPVYVVHDLQIHQRQYIVRLTGQQFQMAPYVADLRLELPIEKGSLVGVRSFPGFATEDEAIGFAEVLGRHKQRAAVATRVNTHVRETMRRKINAKRAAWKDIRDQVHKIMFAIDVGSRLDPTVIRVFVVSIDPLNDDARKWFEDWHAKSRDAAATAGLVLAPMGYMDRINFDVRRYDRLIEINKNF